MSRFTRPKEPVSQGGGTPIWVMIVYALGLMAGAILVLSIAFAAVVSASSDDGGGFTVNAPALVLWAAIVALAAGTLVWRRRGGGR